MSERRAARPSADAGRSLVWLRWLAAGSVAWLFVDAALAMPPRAGASTLGNPPELAVAWVACAAVWASAVVRAHDRLAIARRLVLALLVASLLGVRMVPAEPGLRLLVLGVTLGAAAPWLRARPGAGATLLVLLLALPSVLGTEFPQGAVLWLGYVLPPAALALLLPAVLPGRAAFRAAMALVFASSLASLAALATYPVLASGLALPLDAVFHTRLRFLGLHPNLAVPHLATTLVLGVSLAITSRGRWRTALVAALLPVAGALLALQSRTGLLASGFGLLLLLLPRLPGRLAPWAHRLVVAGVAALLLFPLTGLSDARITQRSSNTVSKAVSFRSAMWELGRDTLAAAPWHGFGPGTAYAQGRYARSSRYDGLPKDDHPHNVVLAAGEALGWPGLLGLALLFLAGVRRPAAGGSLAHAATAAALAMWAADAIDMGGADATLYPSLAFVLLGLRQATLLPDEPGRGAPPGAALRRVAATAAVIVSLVGLLLHAGADCERLALERLDTLAALPEAERAAAAQPTRSALACAATLQPFAPNPALQSARLASLLRDRRASIAALGRARDLYPGSATLAHQLGLALSADDPTDPRVEALLAESVALDPLGPEAWRRRRDHAQVRALCGDARDARDELVEASLINPAAAAGLPQRGSGEALELLPGGEAGAAVPLRDLLDALAARREVLAAEDPAMRTRLRLREAEILGALGQKERAEEAARHLLAEDPMYLENLLARAALERGDPQEALERLRRVQAEDYFETETGLLDAWSRKEPADEAAFTAALAAAIDSLQREYDAVFCLPTVQRMLEAQRRWAERHGDAARAQRFADALDFAAR